MKQFLFTTLLIAFMAISNNAICGKIVTANCLDFNGICLQPVDGETRIHIIVGFSVLGSNISNNGAFESSNWSVLFSTNLVDQVLPKSMFYYQGNGTYKTKAHVFQVPDGFISYKFDLFLMSENADVTAHSYISFPICQNFNRLSSAGIQNSKEIKHSPNENSDTRLDINSFKIYPNPTKSDFTVQYPVNQDEEVDFQVFDIEGRTVYATKFKHQDAGFYTKHFNNLNFTKGIYFCRMETGNLQKTIKLTKL